MKIKVTAVSRGADANLSDDEASSAKLQGQAGVGPFPTLVPNPDFDSEELLAYELGYRVQATERFSVDVALFYNEYDNLLVTVHTPSLDPPASPHRDSAAPEPHEWRNLRRRSGATWQPTDWWRLYGAYTFLEMQLHADSTLPTGTRKSAEATEGSSPQHQVYLQSSFNLPRNVEVDLIGRLVDQLTGFNTGTPTASVPNEIDAYFSLGARLAWKPHKNLEISVVSKNLLDPHYPESGTSTAIRAPLVEIQRSVYGKVTWRF